jgi:hypothetical protein
MNDGLRRQRMPERLFGDEPIFTDATSRSAAFRTQSFGNVIPRVSCDHVFTREIKSLNSA